MFNHMARRTVHRQYHQCDIDSDTNTNPDNDRQSMIVQISLVDKPNEPKTTTNYKKCPEIQGYQLQQPNYLNRSFGDQVNPPALKIYAQNDLFSCVTITFFSFFNLTSLGIFFYKSIQVAKSSLVLYTSGSVSLKERLMYFQNELFVKQVKSFYLLLDQDPFIFCVHFTTKSTTSPSYVYSITKLSHSLFPFKVILSRTEFICILSISLHI